MKIPLGMIAAGAGIAADALGIGDKRQIKQQEKLNENQAKHNKDIAKYNKELELQQWKDTNYSAQKMEMVKAGLNPGLLYGMGGSGGATVGGGGASGVSGGQAANSAQTTANNLGMAMQIAQTQVLKATAEKTEAETQKIKGVETSEAETRIKALSQGIENAKAQEQISKIEIRLKELEEYKTTESMEDALDYIEYQAQRAGAEFELAANEAYINKQTRQQKIQIIQSEAIGAILRNALTKAQTNKTNSDITVNEAQIKKISEDIAQGWAGLGQGDSKIAIEKFKGEVQGNYPGLLNVLGRGLDDTIDGLLNIMGTPRSKNKQVK